MATSLRAAGGTVEQPRRNDRTAGPHRSRETPPPNAVPVLAASATPAAKPQGNSAPTADQIRCRAYDICCARNGAPGDALGDWLEAEQELCASQCGPESIEKKREMALLAPIDGDPMC